MTSTRTTVISVLSAMARPWSCPPKEILIRLNEAGIGSLFLVFTTVAAVGATMCDQAAAQALRLLGDQSFIGPEYIVLGFEEYGPLVVSVAYASRVGAGFAATIATLSAEQTLAALTLYGAKPERNILAPMGLAAMAGALTLGLLSVVAWEIAGVVTMTFRHGHNPLTFFRPDAVHFSSLVILVVKSLGAGFMVFLASLIAGLRAQGGAEEVGRATTEGVVFGIVFSLIVHVGVDFVWFFARGPS